MISNCPQSIQEDVSLGTTSRIVTWVEPTATDDSGNLPSVIQSHRPGQLFSVGTTQVTYTFRDQSGNEAVCSFTVTGNLSEILLAFLYIACIFI